MITDSQTSTVYFSKWLQDDKRFAPACERIVKSLDEHHVAYQILEGTKDIWARDYMPVPVNEMRLVQFRYEPRYLKDQPQYQSNPSEVLLKNGLEAYFSNLNIDGGNVVRASDKVIMTTRIFSENPKWERSKLVTQLEKELECEVFLIPDLPKSIDMTGHADGHLRFIDDHTLLVNELSFEDPKWVRGFKEMISQSGLNYMEIPWFTSKTESKVSAVGIYVNYLEVGNIILFPIFEVPGNNDRQALERIHAAFPTKQIIPIQVNEIARSGGILNCVSWGR
jgi:agmatine deiminase